MNNIQQELADLRRTSNVSKERLINTCVRFLNKVYSVVGREDIDLNTDTYVVRHVDKELMLVIVNNFVFHFTIERDRKDRTSTVIHYSVNEHDVHDLKDIARASFSSDDSFYRDIGSSYTELVKIGKICMDNYNLIRPWDDLLYMPDEPELEEDGHEGLSAMLSGMGSRIRSMKEFGTPFIINPLVEKADSIEEFKFFSSMVLNMLENNESVEGHDWLRDIDFELNKYVVNNELNQPAVKDALIWQLANMDHGVLYTKRKYGGNNK